MKNTLRVRQVAGAAFLTLVALVSLACQSKKTTTTINQNTNTTNRG
jgi:hypothetical protein